jgi:hypothetical protein
MWAIPGFSPTGPLLCGSIAHDFGYQYGYLLSPLDAEHRTYPEYSMSLRERFVGAFGNNVPVFIGRNQVFFDQLLSGITIDATGQRGIAWAARAALYLFGGRAWRRYRTDGPSAYNQNSLWLPGVTLDGVRF